MAFNSLKVHPFQAIGIEYEYQLAPLHLGLPNWQYAFTDHGLEPAAKQWFRFLGPERLAVDLAQGKAEA